MDRGQHNVRLTPATRAQRFGLGPALSSWTTPDLSLSPRASTVDASMRDRLAAAAAVAWATAQAVMEETSWRTREETDHEATD